MTQRVYATAADFYDFIGGNQPMTAPAPPALPVPITDKELDARLRRASGVIDGITRMSKFEVDEDGYASVQAIADAFRDATCAQVAYWDETEDPTGALSQEGTFSIGSVSIGARGRSSGNSAPDENQARIGTEAVEILTTAGLITAITAYR